MTSKELKIDAAMQKYTLCVAKAFYVVSKSNMQEFRTNVGQSYLCHNTAYQAVEQLLHYWLVCLGETPYETHSILGLVEKLKKHDITFMLEELIDISELIETWGDDMLYDETFVLDKGAVERVYIFYNKLLKNLLTIYPPK